MNEVWLNVGSGGRKLAGFVNIDRESGGDIQADLGSGLPFASNSVKGIYCEHFIEHLSRPDCSRFLRECRRVLAPRGRLRIATPDLDYVVSKYRGNWRDQAWLRDFGYEWINNRCECLNIAMREWGHQWLYNDEELTRLALYAGMASPSRCRLGESGDPHLAGLEWRQDSSLIMEFTKIQRPEECEPLVSVLIPAYKHTYFRSALESALAQTYRNIEIVVCDDSSTDHIERIIDHYSAGDERIRYSRNSPPLGAYGNHLQCFNQVSGDYVKFLNDDDRLHPLCVEEMVHCLRTHPEVTIVTSHRRCVDSDGVLLPDIPAARPIVKRDSILDGAFVASALLASRLNFLGEPTTAMFRRHDLEGTSPDILSFAGRQSAWNSDVAMWLTLLSKGDAAYLVRSLSDFRLHPDQQSHASGALEKASKAWDEMIHDGLRMGFLERGWQLRSRLRHLDHASPSYSETSQGKRPSYNNPGASQQRQSFPPATPSVSRSEPKHEEDAETARKTATLVSVIIPTFNNLKLTRHCLEALLANTPAPHEVIVVDNGSTDGTAEYLRQQAERGSLKVIRNVVNQGFAKACNEGASRASGEYFLFLNNDVQPHMGWLEPLVDILRSDPLVGAVGSKLLFPDGTLQHAGIVIADNRQLPDPLMAENAFRGKPSVLPEACQRRTYQALTAACLLVRRSAFTQVGGFDEDYWNGYEDIDLCFKLRDRGWTLVYEPHSVLTHQESMSGPERFSKVRQNVARLHRKWLGRVTPDIMVEPDGTRRATTANCIQPYQPPTGRDFASSYVRTSNRVTTIIILAHNQITCTKSCLSSIDASTPELHEIIVVDNGSTDGTGEFLREYARRHANVRIVKNGSNRGFAAGNNQGLALASGDYVVLLNNDTIVTDGWLGRLLAVFESHPGVGIVGPVSNYVSGPQLVPEARYESDAEIAEFAACWANDHAGQSKPITRVVGFCLAVRRELIERIGGLDEQFGSGNFEDDDYCLRAAAAGFTARIALDSFVHHHGNRTFIGANIDWRKSMLRNWEFFKKKWGIPSDTPLEKGYKLPNKLPAGLSLHSPLPDISRTHRRADGERLWQETGRRLTDLVDAESSETLNQMLAAGQAALDAEDVETATREFALVVDKFPGLAAGHAALGSCMMAQGLFREAVPLLRHAVDLAPSADLHNRLGVALFQSENHEGAETAFRQAREVDPRDIQSLLNLIDLYRTQERYVEATQSVKEALQIDPNHPEVLVAFGILSLELGDVEGGQMALQRLETVSPDHSACQVLRQAVEQMGSKATEEETMVSIR